MRETVDALNALSIFGPHHQGAYREHAAFVRGVLGADVPTRVSEFVVAWANSGSRGVVVLTGNAGTGKTAIAEAFCAAVGGSLPSADGLIEVAPGRFVVKDLSGVARLEDRVAIVELADKIRAGANESKMLLCANEGLLRAVTVAAGSSQMRSLLDGGLARGAVRQPGAVLVNMNRQRWTAPDIWNRLLDYLTREEVWRPCEVCEGALWCPIRANAAALRESSVRESTRWLVQFAAGSGVATLRELLAVLAHAITGGLDCDEVRRRYDLHGETAFTVDQAYFNQLLGSDLSDARTERSSLLLRLRECGVGDAADLEVDGWLRDPGDAPREVRRLAAPGDSPAHANLATPVGPMSFEKLGETISLSDDRTTVESCLANLSSGRRYLVAWRRRVFFEAAPFVRGRTGVFTRMSKFSVLR